MIFRNLWFRLSQTQVFAGTASCAMKAKGRPTQKKAVRQVKTGLPCESGVHSGRGTQRVFHVEPQMRFLQPIVLPQ